MEHIVKHKTLYDAIFEHKNVFLDIFMMVLGTAFLAGMAQIRIPLWPVPITMQTFGIFLIAFFFGSRKGLLTILMYVLAGIAGIGVFAGFSSGMTVILGPTGGYIIGFLACVFVVGLLIEKGYGRTKKSVLYCMILGSVAIYIPGLIWLWIFLGNVSIWAVLMAGLIPFIIGDTLKIIAAVALFPYLWKGSEKLTH